MDIYSYGSNEVKKELKVSDCKLMHLREKGLLRATNKGRAFLYHKKDVEDYQKIRKVNDH